MDLLSMITKQLSDPKVLAQLGKSAGTQPKQAQQVTENALPMLLSALQQNAKTPEGAQSLDKAIEQHKDDQVGDLQKFFQNVDTNDGAKILQHIFSNKNEAVQANLAQKTGLQQNQVLGLMTQLAPLVLGMLGNQKKAQGAQGDVMNLLGSVMGMMGNQQGSQSGTAGVVGSILNKFLKK
jgi:hypothetical protein